MDEPKKGMNQIVPALFHAAIGHVVPMGNRLGIPGHPT